MEKVTLRHPELPDQPIDVRPAAVPEWEKSGWTFDGPVAVTEAAPQPLGDPPPGFDPAPELPEHEDAPGDGEALPVS